MSIQAVIVNGKDGKVARHQLRDRPRRASTSATRACSPAFKSRLPGKKVGARVLIAVPPADAFGDQGNDTSASKRTDTVVFVIDVVSATKPLAEATARPWRPKTGLPTVTMNEGKPATITIPKGAKPPTQDRRPARSSRAPAPRSRRARPCGSPTPAPSGRTATSSTPAPAAPSSRYFDFQHRARARSSRPGTTASSARRSAAACSSSSRRPTATAPPAARRRSSGTDTLVFVVDILAAY